MKTIEFNTFSIGPAKPLVLIAGPCVIENEEIVMRTAGSVKEIADRLGMPYILKSSYTKDNRSSSSNFQGPGLDQGLKILSKAKERFGIPVLSDVHNPSEVAAAAEVLDIIQIPAYLCMQTSLVRAAAQTGRTINVKKGQFLAPGDMANVIGKIEAEGNHRILLTERGTFFGYHNLVVDMRSLVILQGLGYPVVIDPTHAIRVYGLPSSDPRGGNPEYVPALARAAVAAGCQAVFIETHPNCAEALCDAASMWPLQRLENLLVQLVEIHERRLQLESKWPA